MRAAEQVQLAPLRNVFHLAGGPASPRLLRPKIVSPGIPS